MAAKITYRRHWFWKNEVMVKIPIQTPEIKPKRMEIPENLPMAYTPRGFKPLKPIINLKIVDVKNPGTVVTKFSPAIVIRVRYYQQDLDDAERAGGMLALGFWDGKRWRRFGKKRKSPLRGWSKKNKKGWATVKVSGWPDPTIALGT